MGLTPPVKWHCGDQEVDPWEWRMRVLEERTDIAYSKVFRGTSGFITVENFWAERGLEIPKLDARESYEKSAGRFCA